MQFLKKLIREELEKVLANLNEVDFYKSVDYDKISSPENGKDSIIYNYEKGRTFAGDTLEVDIVNLNRYELVEYLPKSINEESWSFEFYTVYGTILIVDIKRTIRGGKNFWTLKFGQLYKGEQIPSLIGEMENIEGYENFKNAVNKNIALKMDPSKY
jgi:hypothetical protein